MPTKPSIQALERAQPDLKLPNGRALTGQATTTSWHGTTTLFAALEVAIGRIIAAHSKRAPSCRVPGFINSSLPPSRLSRWMKIMCSGSRLSPLFPRCSGQQENRPSSRRGGRCPTICPRGDFPSRRLLAAELQRPFAPDRRRHDRDTGLRAGPLQGDPSRSRGLLLPLCETVVQTPAPYHTIARGRAGPGLLAHIVVSKFDDHLPLYRQAEIYARDGVELETSTLSGWVGATAAALAPLGRGAETRCDGIRRSAWRRYPGPGSRPGCRRDQDGAIMDLRSR